MKEPAIDETASRVTDSLVLGEHLYPDVHWVVLGKLWDKRKLVNYPRRDGIVVDMNYLEAQVRDVMERFIHVDFDLMKQTADYYRQKYGATD